jgi:RNA polymerase sigma-70 factor, ECF subfamily
MLSETRTCVATAVELETPTNAEQADAAALRHLHEVHRPVLLNYITRLTKGDVHRAEDILQETFLRAWRNPQARNADGHWNRGFLFTVARRITIDNVRAAQARPGEYLDDRIDAFVASDADDFGRLLDRREVRAALAELPEFQRTILVEIYFRDRSIEETAQTLGIPPGTVKSRTFYALRALRELLVKRGFLAGDAVADGNSSGARDR